MAARKKGTVKRGRGRPRLTKCIKWQRKVTMVKNTIKSIQGDYPEESNKWRESMLRYHGERYERLLQARPKGCKEP